MFLVLSMVPQNAFGLDNHTVDGSGNWTINNEAGLKAFRDAVNGGNKFEGKTVTLAADLDFTNDAESWKPIGENYNKSFKGTFNGGSHTIDGLHINGANTDYQGLFGYAGGGEITDLKLTNVKIDGGNEGYVGGICGSSFSISNCTVEGEIKGIGHVGGICGWAISSISNCTVSGTVTAGVRLVGGICGYSTSSIQGCASFADVTGNDHVGGIAGWGNSVTNCYVNGNVSGKRDVGGIVGSGGTPTSSYFCAGDCVYLNGELLTIEPGWQQAFVDAGWSTDVWNIPQTDATAQDYSLLALPTLKTLPDTIEQAPVLKKTPKSSDFVFTLPDDLDYDGKGKVITIVPKPGITGMGAVTVKYYKVNEDKTLGTASTTPPTDAGRYKVKFDVAAGTEYSAATDLPAMF